MKYLKVTWIHNFPQEPIELYSELDEDNSEVRKVEIFNDGSCSYAKENESVGTTRLSLEPLPSISEIAADPQFKPEEIDKVDFEKIWEKALTYKR